MMNYVLYGTEEYFITQRISKIIAENVKLSDSVAYLDMNETSLESLLDEAVMIPLFEDKKVIVARHASFLSTKSEKGKDLDPLLVYCKESNPSTILIFVVDGNVDERKKSINELRTYLKFEEFKQLDEMDRKQYVNRFVKENKIDITDNARALLNSLLPNDMRAMQGELEKLALYHERIDEDIVKRLVSRPLEENTFKLVNAIIRNDMKSTLLIWQDFLILNREPLEIMGALAYQLRLCYQVSALHKEGYTDQEIANKLECKLYQITQTQKIIRNVSPDKFLRYLNELSELDTSIKSGKIDKKLGLELFMLKVGGGSKWNH